MRTQNEYLEVKFRNTRVFMTYINLSSDLESNQDLGFNDTIFSKNRGGVTGVRFRNATLQKLNDSQFHHNPII